MVEAGVDCKLSKFIGMFHVFQMFGNLIPEAKEAWEEIYQFVRDRLQWVFVFNH